MISFIGIISVISVVRFISTLSDIIAGLREAGRVLGCVLWLVRLFKDQAQSCVTARPGIVRRSNQSLVIKTTLSNALQK